MSAAEPRGLAAGAVAEHRLLPSGILPSAALPALCELQSATVSTARAWRITRSRSPFDQGSRRAARRKRCGQIDGTARPLRSGSSDCRAVCYGGRVLQATPSKRLPGALAWSASTFCWCRRYRWPKNIVLGREPRRAGSSSTAPEPEAEVLKLAEAYGLAVQPHRPLSSLSVGEAQRVGS